MWKVVKINWNEKFIGFTKFSIYFCILFGCYTTNFVGCLPLAAVHHFRLTKGFPKNSQLQRHLANQNAIWRYFTLIRVCLALLFIISIAFYITKQPINWANWADGSLVNKWHFLFSKMHLIYQKVWQMFMPWRTIIKHQILSYFDNE